MLVLSRKLGERVRIGDNITLVIIDIDRGKVRLGFEAPRGVPIYRQELLHPEQEPTPLPAPPTPTYSPVVEVE